MTKRVKYVSPEQLWKLILQELESVGSYRRQSIPFRPTGEKPYYMVEDKKKLEAQAMEELFTAARQLLKPWSISPEMEKMRETVVAMFEGQPESWFEASVDDYSYDFEASVLKITGTACRLGKVNKNKWMFRREDADRIVQSLIDSPITAVHRSQSQGDVRSIVGKVTKAWQDGDFIKFEGIVEEPWTQKLIKQGYVKYVSVGASGTKKQELNGFTTVLDPTIKELALTVDPAFAQAEIEAFVEED